MSFYVKYLKYKEKYLELKNRVDKTNDRLIVKILFSEELNSHFNALFNNDNFNIDSYVKNTLNIPKNKLILTNILIKYINLLRDIYFFYIKNNKYIIKKNIHIDKKILLIVINNLINYYPTYIYNPIYYPKNIRYINFK